MDPILELCVYCPFKALGVSYIALKRKNEYIHDFDQGIDVLKLRHCMQLLFFYKESQTLSLFICHLDGINFRVSKIKQSTRSGTPKMQ
jgi:hypothetical protein